MQLFTYKVAYDTGFAPNPFFGVLTLATCKPMIRKTAQIGDLIIGYTAKTGKNMRGKGERVLYIAQVSEKLRMEEYFKDKRFEIKKPQWKSNSLIFKNGDNCYELDEKEGKWKQLACWHSEFDKNKNVIGEDPDHIEHDTGGKYVLICKDYIYFGKSAIETPEELVPTIPGRGHRSKSNDSFIQKALDFFQELKKKYTKKIIDRPFYWEKESDDSWKEEKQECQIQLNEDNFQ